MEIDMSTRALYGWNNIIQVYVLYTKRSESTTAKIRLYLLLCTTLLPLACSFFDNWGVVKTVFERK